ncbi:MAG TPA: DNA replication/repair protein RecF [Candidatus Limnocylindrales bacterium]
MTAGPDRPAALLRSLSLRDLRGYRSLEAAFGPGPQLVWGPNAAGKTSLLEAICLLAFGRSPRAASDAELIRTDAELARVVGGIGEAGGIGETAQRTVEVALVRAGGGARKRIQVNGVPRRPASLAGALRVVLFAPEEMLLVAGAPALRRSALDLLAGQLRPAYQHDLATYGRALQQRNGLLRAIREEQASRDELRFWDATLVEAGGAIVSERLRLLDALAGPLAAAQREIAPEEGLLTVRYETNAVPLPGESPRDALARRLAETAEKEVWNGATLVGPHRDDLAFLLAGQPLAAFGSRGQQRTAILAFKLAQLDLLTELDGRPPLLLLDDVFSELDPARRSHLVRRIAGLPQAFVTTTSPDDLDPSLRERATGWRVEPDAEAGASLVPAGVVGAGANGDASR